MTAFTGKKGLDPESLMGQGLITEEEYGAKKKELLDRL
jgi:hypothetical protein